MQHLCNCLETTEVYIPSCAEILISFPSPGMESRNPTYIPFSVFNDTWIDGCVSILFYTQFPFLKKINLC